MSSSAPSIRRIMALIKEGLDGSRDMARLQVMAWEAANPSGGIARGSNQAVRVFLESRAKAV